MGISCERGCILVNKTNGREYLCWGGAFRVKDGLEVRQTKIKRPIRLGDFNPSILSGIPEDCEPAKATRELDLKNQSPTDGS